MISIKKVGNEASETIATLAKDIWPEAYKNIITAEQINYMLELFYSQSSLQHQFKTLKHQFIILYEDEQPAGFASYAVKNETDPTLFRLHKLYVSTNQQGKGFGKKIIDYIVADIKPKGAAHIDLNVNRSNPSFHFYKKNGFTILKEQKLDIGNGYYMDDYIMIKNII